MPLTSVGAKPLRLSNWICRMSSALIVPAAERGRRIMSMMRWLR